MLLMTRLVSELSGYILNVAIGNILYEPIFSDAFSSMLRTVPAGM